jgi:uncharacterized protein YjgD (DUF1641 family)
MSAPIPLEIPPRDPREELRVRLEQAPLAHAEALLAGYEVLQGLQDKGILEGLRGVIGSSDETLELIVEAANSPEVIQALRSLIILSKVFADIDPDSLKKAGDKPLTLFQLFKKLNTTESRRTLTVMTTMLESAGKSLGS